MYEVPRRLRAVFACALLTLGLFILGVPAAEAQDVRNWNRNVARGTEMEFQWLNYDEQTCKDYGYPRLIVTTPPKLGKFRSVRRKFTQQNGRCAGKRLSVLLVYYQAGNKAGRDRTSYTIAGRGNIAVNLNFRVY